MSPRRITLLTDYGPGGEHVGALHARLAAGCPDADRIDLAHDLAPGDVRWGGVVLARLAPLLPDAVHLAVIDPGVGTDRLGVAVATEGGGALVGPDNGLLGLAADRMGAQAAVSLPVPHEAPATFHGRDVFAPAAARLAAGEPLSELGEPLDPAVIIGPALPAAETADGRIAATALGWDRFGNVTLLAAAEELAASGLAPGEAVAVTTDGGTFAAAVARTFADVPPGEVLVFVDSHGYLAVAVNGGAAWDELGLRPDARVAIERR